MTQTRENGNRHYREKYEDLCRELKIDKEIEERSWNKFMDISLSFTMEGNPLHWFCCALYETCCGLYCPTSTKGDNTLGNSMSVIKLLRNCNISIYEFFIKMRKWCKMAKLPEAVINQINKMERGYSITSNVFKRYSDIFEQLFIPCSNEKKPCKYRSSKCTYDKLFELCWCLYLCAKNQNPISQVPDIVMSFHLLICCIDLMYKNVLAESRTDLINTKFDGTPEHWGQSNFETDSIKEYCVIKYLCTMTDASLTDANNMKEALQKIIQKFIDKEVLFGESKTYLGLISNANLERNLKSLKFMYERDVLNMVELDERILLDYRKSKNLCDYGPIKLEQQDIKSLIPNTPYTRKESLPSKEEIFDPVSNATNNVNKLRKIAGVTFPSDFIKEAVGVEILEKINEKLNDMEKLFHSKFPNQEEASNKFYLAKSLYFYLLDKILHFEVRIKPLNLKGLLQIDAFNSTLIACSVEIVLDAYESPLKFPWILNCFNINAFEFHKLIEIIVRSHEGILNREMIKHLNRIEESCLEFLAWKKDSPLWEVIKKESLPLPSWSDVKVGNMENSVLQGQSSINCTYEDNLNDAEIGNHSIRKNLFNPEAPSFEKSDRKKLPLRSTPLKLFLRKFYNLAWVRIKELCKELDIHNEMVLKKIWTLFEYSITQKTELMQDRHLDQIFMCAIYLYIKVGEINGKLFRDIMKFYRKQPQATSSIYRDVLIKIDATTSSSEKEGTNAVYGDIIRFYNEIYMQKMTPYALKFSGKQSMDAQLLLSPHPTEKQVSPRKLSGNHFLFIHSMSKTESEKHAQSPNQLTYEFCRSPGKDLEKFNAIIKEGKRNLPFSIIETSELDKKKSKRFVGNQALLKMMKDREGERK